MDATARSKGGSGLGLAIVKTIVDAWKGQLGVESKRGEGSRFWFSLPIETLDMKALNAAETRQKVAFGEKMKVLLVEDNEINQLVAGGMLDQLKLEYDIAENGKEALDRLHENAYDVVLMDCQMPVMDGYEATASIRHSSQSFNNVYIIALTASAMVEEERKCYRMGMNDFVAKPVIMDSMIRALNKAYCVIQD